MCANFIESFNDLQQELENAKDTLLVLNDNIKRIVGRSPNLTRDRSINNEKTIKKFQQEPFNSKKKIKAVFKRLSPPTARFHDSELKPRLTSRVIRELPSRQEIVAAQCADSESRSRNRRMFGSLLGTLHKFCQEESRLKQKEEKKAQIEKKLEQQEILEKESLKKQRESLFIDRKRKQMEIKRLELKMGRTKDYEIWEHSMKYLKKFIKTKTVPNIYYRPTIFSTRTKKLLTESISDVDKIINKKRGDLKIDLSNLEDDFKLEKYETSSHFDKICGLFQSRCPAAHDVLASSICVIKDIKYKEISDPDSKENKIRNSGEPIVSSSIVVVNH